MAIVYENEARVMQELLDALVLELQNRSQPNIKVDGNLCYGFWCNCIIFSYDASSIWKRIFCKRELMICYNIYESPMWIFTINTDISKIVDNIVEKMNIEDRMATDIIIRDSGCPYYINI